ncbi:MAG: ArsR family transcriptional regulator [Gammaproteobacteria bacterium]|nr:MAG: ArsR family transcriptional regulator [Gammaproteobacteria bacterium]
MINGIPRDNILQAVAGLKGISHEIRLSILCYLSQQPMTVGDLAEAIGTSQSSISQHLSKMQAACWVCADAQGTSRIYRICDPEKLKLLEVLHQIYCKEGQ